ncbi:conserved Plasmodium protein, unknown function [Plasmodium yoelii]|uniref:Uncharacterized protein n=3 Tax=Plasmodium yoelii TaxID=5861 RepID=A0A078KGX7_PLAYE|nr:conserved Plasmodium protein, unknown function [Plasmodium yoelii]CDU20000.1 conserved Plasmodium protein, unknown function [Plasmodium yoelii]VTZ80758.1 conserved Plasmodium protein, unknown function [Plasmodium yoelii]|eukprot:XP_727338.2 conserved Plasmodium protein, unknown function [Plasmodium yoelii]
MENTESFFREHKIVEEKINIIKVYLNEDDEIIKNYSVILENLNYLNNCLNSYREAKTVLDPHLVLLVHAFFEFLKKSFNKLEDLLTYFRTKLENEKKNLQKIDFITNENEEIKKEKFNKVADSDREIFHEMKDDEKIQYEHNMLKLYTIIEEIYKYYNTLISIRGEKKVKTFFPCDSFFLNAIVNILITLKKENDVYNYISNLNFKKTDENNSWVILYVLIIWLSFCLYIPFDILSINKNMLMNVQEIYYYYIQKNDKTKDACSVLYSQFLSREDVCKNQTCFNNFVIFSKEILNKLILTQTQYKSKEINDDLYLINNPNLPQFCLTKYTNILVYGVLLTHKKILKKLDKKVLRNYANFYTFFFIHNHKIWDFTQISKSLKILCLRYYALLFLEKKKKNENITDSSVSCNMINELKTDDSKIGELVQIETNKNSIENDNNIKINKVKENCLEKEHDLFNKFPLFLDINEVFILYQKSKQNNCSEYNNNELDNVKEFKQYICEKDIMVIINILFFYFNDNSNNIRWCLSKSFGNILIYLNEENVNTIINKFNELKKYKDNNILSTINYTFFHSIFHKNSLSISTLNYLMNIIIQSLYMNNDKIYPSVFVLLYSLFKYNKYIKMYYYEKKYNIIIFFFFHLIFSKLIIMSLLEDNINIRKSAISLLQIFIGKFNFFYNFSTDIKDTNTDNLKQNIQPNHPSAFNDSNNNNIYRGTSAEDIHVSDIGNKECVGTQENCQNIFYLDIISFCNLFFNHSKISNYYEHLKNFPNDLCAYKIEQSNDDNEEKANYEKTRQNMDIIKNKIFKQNIKMLSTCNFNELINFKQSVIIKSKVIGNFFMYRYPIIYHLYTDKIFHENVNIRILSSESLANFADLDNYYFIKVVLPFLVNKSYEENVYIKHGAIICISKILLKLKMNIDENLQNEIKQILIHSEKKRVYKYKKGEILRHSLCLLAQSICQCNYFAVKKNTYTFFMDIMHNNLFHYNEIIQFNASKLFYYIPIYIASSENAINYVYQVLDNFVKERNNFIYLKGYLILLCFINENIISHVCSDLFYFLYNILKKCTTYYKVKQKCIPPLESKENHKYDIENEKEDLIDTQNLNRKNKFKYIEFDLYPIDFNMKIFCLFALFNIVDKIRKTYITDFLSLYTDFTISFDDIIESKIPKKNKLNKKKQINSNPIKISKSDQNQNNADKSENSDDSSYIIDETNCENNPESLNTKIKQIKEKRNTSFYMKKNINILKKKMNWEQVIEKGKQNGKNIFQFNLDMDKIAKILIWYLQEYLYEQDTGDSHVYVREVALELVTFLLTSYPLCFFRKTPDEVNINAKENKTDDMEFERNSENDIFVKEPNRNGKVTGEINYTQNNKTYFYETLNSDDSFEYDEESEHRKLLNDKKKKNIDMYILFEIKKEYINIFIQLLLKLLCEKNVRTHKKCLFLLNYLFNYSNFNEKGEKENFPFINIFNKYCHDFSYELYMKKKIDDNIRKSKINIHKYLSSYYTDISSVFENIIMHVCDYHEPIYLKSKTEKRRPSFNHMESISSKDSGNCIGNGNEVENGNEKSCHKKSGKYRNCNCTYDEEITSIYFNKNYKYELIKTIFNKINNFIYLYNYALKYTSFSIFHKNKFNSTRKGVIKIHSSSTSKKNEKEIIENKNDIEKIDNIQQTGQIDFMIEDICINEHFIDEINLSENEEKMCVEDEMLIKNTHFLLDKTKKNISVIKYLEYNETYLYTHIFYLLFLNKYNYYIINGFFNSLCYYSSSTEYSNYEYTNLLKKGKEETIDFLFLEFIMKYKDIYTFGYVRDNLLFLYIRYYVKYYKNYDYKIVDNILLEYDRNKLKALNSNSEKNDLKNDLINSNCVQENQSKIISVDNTDTTTMHYDLPMYRENNEFSLYEYNMHVIDLEEIILLEKKYEKFNFSKNLFHNYNIFLDTNTVFLHNSKKINKNNLNEDKLIKSKQKIKNKRIKKELNINIELLPYINICLIKILYYLNNFSIIQLESFLKSVNSFIKFSLINDFAAFCFLNFFTRFLKKYTIFSLVKTISEFIINIYMCSPLHLNIKKFAAVLILDLLIHRYPKIREFTSEYLYSNINFIAPNEYQNYLFSSYDDLENSISLLINTQFSDSSKENDDNYEIHITVEKIAKLLGISHYITFSS